ncbi:MAG: D-alanyl-D-alanine carboxypeptidase family protein [Chthoniobacteraceae bacterium]
MKWVSFFAITILCSQAVLLPASAATRHKKTGSSSSASSASKPYQTAFDAQGVPIPKASSVVVLNARTGEVLHEINADAPRQAASTQKLLTALIIAESGDLDKEFMIRDSDTWAEPTKLNFQPGEVYSRRELLTVMLVHSMNDCARALARDNAGSIEAFAARMNARARQLGATGSNFLNPNGLPAPGQHSTARDMSKIALAAYANPVIRSIVRIQNLPFRYADGRVRTFDNTNKILGKYPYCNGMKTGYTDAAGKCLIASGSNGRRDVIVVLLGDSIKYIWNDATALLSWGFSS